jgi:hypothetical protein
MQYTDLFGPRLGCDLRHQVGRPEGARPSRINTRAEQVWQSCNRRTADRRFLPHSGLERVRTRLAVASGNCGSRAQSLQLPRYLVIPLEAMTAAESERLETGDWV